MWLDLSKQVPPSFSRVCFWPLSSIPVLFFLPDWIFPHCYVSLGTESIFPTLEKKLKALKPFKKTSLDSATVLYKLSERHPYLFWGLSKPYFPIKYLITSNSGRFLIDSKIQNGIVCKLCDSMVRSHNRRNHHTAKNSWRQQWWNILSLTETTSSGV